MGCSVEELVATPVGEFLDVEAQPAVKERTQLTRAGHRLHFRQELRRADGSTFLADVTSAPLFNAAGRYDGGIALIDDITDRNRADTQARLRATLLDAIGEAVAAATPDGTVVYINPAAERLLGWRAAEAIGRDGSEIFGAPEVAEEGERIHASILKGERFSGRHKMSRRDGTRFVAHLTSAAAFDDDGTLVGLVAVISDETERDQRDRDLQMRALQAETLALLGSQVLRQHLGPPAAATLILTEAADATRRLLRADQAIVFDVIASANELRSKTASPPLDGQIAVPAGSRSFAGYIALARKVVVVDNTKYERRFEPRPTPAIAPPTSAIGAPIFGPEGIVGVLTAESSTPNKFHQRDAHFIQGMANLIGTALLT
jgi:PAS domain S-box-containing protein